MNISPVNMTSFGKLHINDKEKAIAGLSRITQNPQIYEALDDTLKKLDKNTGEDALYLSVETREAVSENDVPTTIIRTMQPYSHHDNKVVIRHDEGTPRTVKAIKSLLDLCAFRTSSNSVEKIINRYGE